MDLVRSFAVGGSPSPLPKCLNRHLTCRPFSLATLQVGVFWDIDSCSVPNNGADDAAAAAASVRDFAIQYGKICTFSAFGDFSRMPSGAPRSLQQLGVSTLDLASARREAADKAIIVELCFFAVANKARLAASHPGSSSLSPIIFSLLSPPLSPYLSLEPP